MSELFLSKPAVICCAGKNSDELWESVINGNQSGIKKVKAVNGKDFYRGTIDDAALKSVNCKYDMRVIQILETAVSQLEETVNAVKARYGADRIAVCVGSCDNGSQLSVAGHEKYLANGQFDADYDIEVQGADYPATYVKERFGLEGPAVVFSTACSSSSTAIIKARQMIKAGFTDAAIAGGVDIAGNTVLLGFDSLEAVSEKVTIPFSANRSGITLGEGAAFFVLSKENDFEGFDRENPVCLLGTGESADASHITAPLADGTGALAAMNAALKDAGLTAEKIDYLNLHGTGTHLNDSMEAKGVSMVFGEYTERLPVSSTKPITGHTLGSAGSLELAVCYMALKNASSKRLPVHVWDGAADTEIPLLNFVSPQTKVEKEIKICMSNSFAFGGCNASLIIGKQE